MAGTPKLAADPYTECVDVYQSLGLRVPSPNV